MKNLEVLQNIIAKISLQEKSRGPAKYDNYDRRKDDGYDNSTN